ncbi:MAG: FHA domain-containing protein, partial [Actinomycetota bacterium]
GKGEFRVEAALAADPDRSAPRMSTRHANEADLSATRAISSETGERLGVGGSQAELQVLDDSGSPQERITITRTPVTIGRLSTNDVCLSDSNVSRRHAELRREGEGWMLVDLGSTNGTLVNGKLAKEHRLKDGDRLAFGTNEVLFKTAQKA